MEWKFARSLLYMEYIGEGATLPPPLNIIGAPKAIIRAVFCCSCRDDNDDDDVAEEVEPKPTANGVKQNRPPSTVSEAVDTPESVAIPSTSSAQSFDGASGVSMIMMTMMMIMRRRRRRRRKKKKKRKRMQ